jgi:hypothetical protein
MKHLRDIKQNIKSLRDKEENANIFKQYAAEHNSVMDLIPDLYHKVTGLDFDRTPAIL